MTEITLLIVIIVLAVLATSVLVRRGHIAQLPSRVRRLRWLPSAPSAPVPDGMRLADDPGYPVTQLQSGGTAEIEWMTRADLQPTQALSHSAARVLAADRPLGLAVVALATGSVGYPQPDVYYVQRNVIALARGLSGAAAGQRAAALALSGVLTSPLGRVPDTPRALRDGATSANQLIRLVSGRDPEHSDMATTLDVVFVAEDGDRRVLYYGHVGNASIWLQRIGDASLELITQSHSIDGGQVLRAVGISPDVTPDVGEVPVELGDRIFLTTASSYFAFPATVMHSVTAANASKSLVEAVAALADAARQAATPDGITIIAGEVTRSAASLA